MRSRRCPNLDPFWGQKSCPTLSSWEPHCWFVWWNLCYKFANQNHSTNPEKIDVQSQFLCKRKGKQNNSRKLVNTLSSILWVHFVHSVWKLCKMSLLLFRPKKCCQKVWNDLYRSNMASNDLKWSWNNFLVLKWLRWTQMLYFGLKWPQITLNGLKWQKIKNVTFLDKWNFLRK